MQLHLRVALNSEHSLSSCLASGMYVNRTCEPSVDLLFGISCCMSSEVADRSSSEAATSEPTAGLRDVLL